MSTRRDFMKRVGQSAAALSVTGMACAAPQSRKRPNILFAIADDWSWPHASIAGSKFVNTPSFDSVARNGVLFTNAFVTAPSCTPSRGSIVTGQWHWRLEENIHLWSTLNPKFDTYPQMLENSGYHVGCTGKGWGPGDWKKIGRPYNPAGKEYNEITCEVPYTGIRKTDYAANFDAFLEERPDGAPICFWLGGSEPHRQYEKGSGLHAGKNVDDVDVPKCMPDVEEVRSDLLDYAVEVEWFDSHLGRVIAKLEEIGELDNTIIAVTGDNGLPFPGCKSNLYDWGTHVPLAVQFGAQVSGGRTVEDFMSLSDLAPTFLEVAGVEVPSAMTGRSFLEMLQSGKRGRIDPQREHVLTGKERHTPAQEDLKSGYPCRAIRTHDYLYIRNFEPGLWPAGYEGHPYNDWMDIDNSPAKTYMMDHRNDPNVRESFAHSFGMRPAEEFYDLRKDPQQMHNVSDDPAYTAEMKKLSETMMAELRATGDPRVLGCGDQLKEYPYLGRAKKR